MQTCPQCDGFGRIFFAFPRNERAAEGIPCPLCAGSGVAAGDFDIWKRQGEIIKERRIAAGLSLRQAAKRFRSLDPSNLSKMERGLMKPAPLSY